MTTRNQKNTKMTKFTMRDKIWGSNQERYWSNPMTRAADCLMFVCALVLTWTVAMRPCSAAERPRLELPERKIVVDADPADWKGVPATVVQGERHLWFGQGMTRENWKGNNDLSYSWRAAWHGNKLYFLFEVNDDKVLEPTQSSSFLNDSVEMFLDWGGGGGQRVKVMDGRPDWFSKCDPKEMMGHELHFLPTTPPRVYLDHREKYATDKPHSDEFAKQWAGETAVKKTATGYIMEIGFALPGVGFKPGKVMGLELGVNDDDGQGRKSIMIWPATKSDFWLIMDEYCKIVLTQGDRK